MTNKDYQRTLAVFDLDNTLIDSQAKLTADFRGAMNRLGVEMTPEEAKAGRWYETAQRYGFTKEQFDQAFDKRKTWEQSLRDGEVSMFSDARPCLEELASGGVRLALLSRSVPEYTDAKLKHFGLNKYFERIVTVDPKASTKKYGALHLVSEIGPAKLGPITFIGDRSEDVSIARDVAREYEKVCNGLYLNRSDSRMPEELRDSGYLSIKSLKEVPVILLPEDIS